MDKPSLVEKETKDLPERTGSKVMFWEHGKRRGIARKGVDEMIPFDTFKRARKEI